MSALVLYAALAGAAAGLGAFFGPALRAQPNEPELQRLRANDRLRACPNREQVAANATGASGELVLDEQAWGNNPQEGQYRAEMERLLKIEVQNVREAIAAVERKYAELVRARPSAARNGYKEIRLEDKPGVWRDGVYVNSQKIIALHFDAESQKLDCAVLDALVQSVYLENLWTRKLMRLYNPHIQSVELHTLRKNFTKGGSLIKTDPKIQLKGLRLFTEDLRASLYAMDMEIAAHYDRLNRVNAWQLGL